MNYVSGAVETDSYASGKYETRLGYTITPNNEKNQSTIYTELQVRSNNVEYWTESSDTPAYINGVQVHDGYFYFGGSTNWQVLGSRTWTVSHDDDGKLTYNLNASFSSSATGTYIVKSGYVSKDVIFPTIPRKSPVTAIDSFIGSATTININKSSSTFKHTLKYEFGSLDGTIVSMTDLSSYGWTIPTSFYEEIPNISSGTCKIICETFNNGLSLGTTETTFIVRVNPEINRPILEVSVEDVNPKTLALTGNKTKVIKFNSNVKVNITATPKNSATISSYLILCEDGKGANTQTATLNAVEGNHFRIGVMDSRGISNVVEKELTLIEYIKLTAKATFKRRKPTDNKVLLSVTGNYFNQSFGAEQNTLSCKYRYRKKGTEEWSDYTNVTATVNDDNTYKINDLLLEQDFNYKEQFEFEFLATDELMLSLSKGSISVGEYMWARGKSFANFLVAPFYKYKRLLTFDEAYPIGSYYETDNLDFDPNNFWGGTWELDEDGTVLASRATNVDSILNSDVGEIVGEHQHQLLLD